MWTVSVTRDGVTKDVYRSSDKVAAETCARNYRENGTPAEVRQTDDAASRLATAEALLTRAANLMPRGKYGDALHAEIKAFLARPADTAGAAHEG